MGLHTSLQYRTREDISRPIYIRKAIQSASMGYLSLVLLFGVALALPEEPENQGNPENAVANNAISRPEEPKNQGKPLGEEDFFLASQLPIIPRNITTDQLMKIIEDGELKGSKNTPEVPPQMPRRGLEPTIRHWPNAIVPYIVDASFTSNERAVIAQGIRHVEDNSCIRFVPRDGDYDYLDIVPGAPDAGCYAQIPYYPGRGRMEIGLEQSGCVYMSVVVHELLHTLGVKHEQSRPDRDDYITIHWANFKPKGPSQFYKDAWVGTDPATLPGICSETLDYGNCFSGWFTSACGFAYDYSSIMHYSATSFGIDGAVVMTPTDSSVTTLGNSVLSPLDKDKIQCMYDCSMQAASNCGGHFYGTSGALSGSCCCGGDWLLRTETGKGIVINFSVFSVPGDCTSEYLEVYPGSNGYSTSDASGTLIGKFCDSNPPPASLSTKSSSIWINFVKTKDSSTSLEATWTAETMICCGTVMVENFDGQTSRQGLFSPMSDGTTFNGVPVYEQEDGDQQMWRNGGWMIGPDYSGGYGISSTEGNSCPENVRSLTYYDYSIG